ncbi:hypothetical protein F5144DRAFT_600448 [Chaetomium tenue]|uniref:Uncharacterized protein n=1 Tax=Chaetomium tenue TaxID=1854479 RepID=A0ACB7PK01_9PEZI|nr:hypothetical protein F5144DRAFT_600448 [Chaetomium globosum]
MPTDDELVKEMEILLQEQQQNIRDWITLDVARSAMVIGLVTSIVLATRYGYHFSTQRH